MRSLQRDHVQAAGSSFSEELTRERLSAAAELLAGQAIPVALIARLVGYSDGSSFARAFRRRYGLPPSRFRAEARAARRLSRVR